MNKINLYGNFFILSTSESTDAELSKLDGTCFEHLYEGVEFMLKNKEKIATQSDKIFLMVWREIFDNKGNLAFNDCIDEIHLEDIINER